MELNSIKDIVDIGCKFKHNWYRGHSDTYGTLVPKIRRQQFNSALHSFSSSNLEFEIINQFKRIAPSLQSNLPIEDNHLAWLFLMQHHGAPTRLLDWSESILVAAFFAVKGNFDKDAEIWRIYPQQLNVTTANVSGFPLESSKYLKFLSGEPLHNNPDQLAAELDIAQKPNGAVAFYPTISFARMSSQQSTFTIHPFDENPITDILDDEKYLTKYLIPRKVKKQILDDLLTLGVNHRTLFPDLDHLAMDFNQKYSNPFWYIWGQPKSK